MVVEDDVSNLKYLCAALKPYGDIIVATNGNEALELFRRFVSKGTPVDVIFLDILMPDRDGFEVEKEIRGWEEQNQIPYEQRVKVIMATGAAETNFVLKGFKLGCDLYLPKPFSLKQLAGFMKELGFQKLKDSNLPEPPLPS